ncbi:unnamed protein product [Gadus morhua 'NCC']
MDQTLSAGAPRLLASATVLTRSPAKPKENSRDSPALQQDIILFPGKEQPEHHKLRFHLKGRSSFRAMRRNGNAGQLLGKLVRRIESGSNDQLPAFWSLQSSGQSAPVEGPGSCSEWQNLSGM